MIPHRQFQSIFVFFTLLTWSCSAQAETALSMHGEPTYGSGFSDFNYVNADAPKGGSIRLPIMGSFDSLQPFLIKGVVAAGLGLVYQSLMERSKDEPFSLYPSLAQSFDIATDRSWIKFKLDPTAQFSDGSPVTIADILFSFETLRDKGRPNHRQYYSEVSMAKQVGDDSILFEFKADSGAEIPLILALMPVLSKRYFQTIPFTQAGLDIPLGSGPYYIKDVDAGRHITYQRNPHFWGNNKPVFAGRYNFDQIQYDYFRDIDIAFEAMKAGQIDIFFESEPSKWTDRKNFSNQSIQSKTIDFGLPPPFLGLVFNSRKPVFANRLTRIALTLAYDFDWVNQNLLHGLYKRTTSYFGAGNLQAHGLPDTTEKQLLMPFAKQIPDEVFTKAFRLPTSDGNGRIRERLRKASALLKQAGFKFQGRNLVHPSDAKPVEIELITSDKSHLKLLSSFQKNLRTLGIDLKLRLLDSASYQNRIGSFDFDMMVAEWGQSLSPGNEQIFYWHSRSAETPGSRNYPGIKNKAIDHLTQIISETRDRSTLEAAVRALDRLLLWGYYAIPLHHSNQQWIYHTPRLGFPVTANNYGTSIDLWWSRKVDVTPSKRP